MKLLIIGFTKLKYMPYAEFYLKNIDPREVDIDFVYWDRDDNLDMDYNSHIKYFKFDVNMQDSLPLIKKMKYFLKFRKFTKKIINSKEYDKFIILHTTPAVLLFDLFVFSNKKYILDYRDVTYEHIYIYKKMISLLVKNSHKTFISSKGFKPYLPNCSNILYSHNLDYRLNETSVHVSPIKSNLPIKIVYWGLIRHRYINKQLIKSLANDARFEIHYHGRSQKTGKELEYYVKKHKISNVFFHGEYLPSEKKNFIGDADIIHNAFDNDVTMKPATSNKFYDGLVLGVPQLCTKDSYMGNLVEEKGLGITLDLYNDMAVADRIYNYYSQLDLNQLQTNAKIYLREVKNELKDAQVEIKKFVFSRD